MRLPDFAPIPPEAFAALASEHHVSVSQITPLPDIGITNKIYRFGDALILRIPRHHPHIINLARKEARVVPIARAAGVHTPAILLFDDTCDLLPVPYTLYERAPGETLGLLDLEPEATPNVWRALGRDLARLHTSITPALLPPEEVGQCDDLRAAPRTLAEAGLFTRMEARWLERLLDRLAPYALVDLPQRFLHGDSQSTNMMVEPGSLEYLAVLDWGSSGWGDVAWDFLGIPLRAVPFMLEGHREISPLDEDETAEARILWRHLQIAIWLMQRDPQPTYSWAERPLAMFLEIMRFLLESPDPRWRAYLPNR
ncbi:MAG TPA: aminoglycoside phosphotransferase family protein [Ktedonobacterales bacterium]|jgi:aminoglycoside phosphotransferase (APT) family kinase protein